MPLCGCRDRSNDWERDREVNKNVVMSSMKSKSVCPCFFLEFFLFIHALQEILGLGTKSWTKKNLNIILLYLPFGTLSFSFDPKTSGMFVVSGASVNPTW